MKYSFEIDGKMIEISNPEKWMWPEQKVRKIDFIQYLLEVSKYMLPHVQNRLLTTIRYPDGVTGKSFYQKNKPNYAPNWIRTALYEDTNYILLNDRAILVYLGNQACLEYHISFHYANLHEPTELVFDLDPSVPDFQKVIDGALLIKEELDHLRLRSYIKTSGATGLQVYIPIKAGVTFEETRKFGEFFAAYMAKKYPRLITVERMVKKRGDKVYFDYLQHWKGKSLIAPYSTRARSAPYVSTPLLWTEVPHIHPEDYTIFTILPRLKEMGDLFDPLLRGDREDLKSILTLIPSPVS